MTAGDIIQLVTAFIGFMAVVYPQLKIEKKQTTYFDYCNVDRRVSFGQ